MSWSAAPEPPPAEPERTPESARAVFGDRVTLAEQFAALLLGAGAERGLIGPREAGRIWTRHVLGCAVVADCIPPGARVCDLGSGAGLPGIPLALARPDVGVVLVEPMARRTAFLEEAVQLLGVGNITVVRERAQDHARSRRASYDVVTARAVTNLDALIEWAQPLLRPGGRLVAVKGDRAHAELEAAAPRLAASGATGTVTSVGRGVVEPPATVVVVATGGGT